MVILSRAEGSFTTSDDSDMVSAGREVAGHPINAGFNRDVIDLWISGTFVGTVNLQLSKDDGANFETDSSYTGPTKKKVDTRGDNYIYRLNYVHTSGTADYLLG